MPTVNVDRAMSNLDPWIESTQSVQEGKRKIESSTLAMSDGWRSLSPTAKTVESKLLLNKATSAGGSISKVESPKLRAKVRPGEATIELTGSQALKVGRNHLAAQPSRGYNPTPGLIGLFSKTGTGSRNPKHLARRTTPPNQTPPPRRSYAGVLHNGMEGRGHMFRNGSGNASVVGIRSWGISETSSTTW
jgi:hypothetical protein